MRNRAKTPSAAPTADTNNAESPTITPPQIREKAGRIQYVGPDTYILLDAQGRPQPVPGMTYEDFLAAWKKSQQASKPDTTPRYVLESIEIGRRDARRLRGTGLRRNGAIAGR